MKFRVILFILGVFTINIVEASHQTNYITYWEANDGNIYTDSSIACHVVLGEPGDIVAGSYTPKDASGRLQAFCSDNDDPDNSGLPIAGMDCEIALTAEENLREEFGDDGQAFADALIELFGTLHRCDEVPLDVLPLYLAILGGATKNHGSPGDCGVGNPCNPATGNKFQQ